MELWYLVPAALVFAAFTQGAIGFGYAVVAMGVLPLVIDIRLANLVVTVSILPMLLWATSAYRRDLESPSLLRCLVGMWIGLPIGILLFTQVPAAWLTLGTAAVIFAIGVDGLLARHGSGSAALSPVPNWYAVAAGVGSGIMSGAVGIGGPPLAAYAIRQPWTIARAKAFMTVCFLLQVVLKLIGLSLTGWIDGEVLRLSAAAAPLGFLGIWLGAKVTPYLNRDLFRQLTALLLIFLAVMLTLRVLRPAG